MGYQVFLERKDGAPIPLVDWQTAVVRSDDLRIAVDEQVVTNTHSSGHFTRKPAPGDAELWLAEPQLWVPVFRYEDGRVSSFTPPDFDDPQSPFREILRALARVLEARIVGEEGEVYR